MSQRADASRRGGGEAAPPLALTPELPEGLRLLCPPGWKDYVLLDSGDGAKLERFGAYTLVRPDQQAMWKRHLPRERWEAADAIFEKGGASEAGGVWIEKRPIPERWPMSYDGLTFWARLTTFRHTGVFPEQATHWAWIHEQIARAGRPIRMLDLFAYTALSTLFAARAGARVTYVDASRPAMGWARENAESAGLADQPIRWMLDDAPKFVRREARRGQTYDALLLDPPVFGRGPSGEIWRLYESLPPLLEVCQEILSDRPLFVLINAYAIDVSPTTLANLLSDLMGGFGGRIDAGELGLREEGTGRVLGSGMFGRWMEGEAPESPP